MLQHWRGLCASPSTGVPQVHAAPAPSAAPQASGLALGVAADGGTGTGSAFGGDAAAATAAGAAGGGVLALAFAWRLGRFFWRRWLLLEPVGGVQRTPATGMFSSTASTESTTPMATGVIW